MHEAVFKALAELSVDGWPASVREVGALAGVSVSTAHRHLVALEHAGRAERHVRATIYRGRPQWRVKVIR